MGSLTNSTVMGCISSKSTSESENHEAIATALETPDTKTQDNLNSNNKSATTSAIKSAGATTGAGPTIMANGEGDTATTTKNGAPKKDGIRLTRSKTKTVKMDLGDSKKTAPANSTTLSPANANTIAAPDDIDVHVDNNNGDDDSKKGGSRRKRTVKKRVSKK